MTGRWQIRCWSRRSSQPTDWLQLRRPGVETATTVRSIEMQTIPTASPSPSATANLSCSSEATGATRTVRRSASTSNTHTASRPHTPSATLTRQKTSSPSVIVTRSVSASGTLVPLAPYRTLPQPVFGAAAGTAVAATSHSVAALAAIASPSGTAQVGKMQSALRLFLCNPPQDDPIPLYVFPIQAAFGDSRMPQVAGTVVLSSALYAAVPALCWIDPSNECRVKRRSVPAGGAVATLI